MGFLDALKSWVSKKKQADGPPEPTVEEQIDNTVAGVLEGILGDLVEREAENRMNAKTTESFHQRDKHNDRADEDAWLAAKIRAVL